MNKLPEVTTTCVEENINPPKATQHQVRPAVPVVVSAGNATATYLDLEACVLAGDLDVLPQERRLRPGARTQRENHEVRQDDPADCSQFPGQPGRSQSEIPRVFHLSSRPTSTYSGRGGSGPARQLRPRRRKGSPRAHWEASDRRRRWLRPLPYQWTRHAAAPICQ